MQMKRTERKNIVKANETNKEIKALANAHGYEAAESYITSYGKPEIGIRPKDRFSRCFTPEIYMRGHWDMTAKEYIVEWWEIQTTSYGALCPEDIEAMMEKMQDALNLVKSLKNIDWTQLCVLPEKFDDEDDA